MEITFSNNKIAKINNMDFFNKSALSSEKEDADAITGLVVKLLDRIKHYRVDIKGLVLVSEGQYNDHMALYCWCTDSHGFLVTKSSNNSYRTYMIDATYYEKNDYVSQSQLDVKSRDHMFPKESRTGNWDLD